METIVPEKIRPLLLLGAGASSPFGIPTMDGFLEDSWRAIEDDSVPGSLACRRSLELYEKIDLEEVMFLLEALADLDREEPLAVPFLGRVQAKWQKLRNLPEVDELRAQAQDARLALRRTIYETCTNYEEDTTRTVYGRLLTSLYEVCEPERIFVATTNYDRIIENLWEGTEQGLHTGSPSLELQSGFHQPDYGNRILDVERGYPEAGERTDCVVQLIKLHGSLGWREYQQGRVQDTGAREFAEEDAILAYPVRSDKSTQPPFSKLFEAFDEALAESNAILIIGISLRDQAIVDRLAEALRPGKKIAIILDPKPEAVRNKLPSSVRKYVVPIEGYFGPDEVALGSIEEWEKLIADARNQWLAVS